MRQNGTNAVTLTRRIVLGGGLSAALGGHSARARADAPRRRLTAFSTSKPRRLGFKLAPQLRLNWRRLTPMPALVPGPLIRLRQGDELRLRFSNKLAEPTTLSFPGLRAANAAAGIGGLTQERLKPGASAEIRFVPPDSGFNTLPAPRGLDRSAARARAIRPDHRRRAEGAGRRPRRRGGSVRVERRRERPDQGRFRRSCHRPGKRAKGRRRFRQWRDRAVEAQGSTRRTCPAASRQRRDRASGDRRDKRRKDPHRGRRRPAGRAVRTPQQSVSDGSWRPVRTDVRYAAQPRR